MSLNSVSQDFNPYIRTPITDVAASIGICQGIEKCASMEMTAANCLEAYGLEKGKVKCKDYIDDFHECIFQKKEAAYVKAIRKERERQFRQGKIKEKWAPSPNMDAY